MRSTTALLALAVISPAVASGRVDPTFRAVSAGVAQVDVASADARFQDLHKQYIAAWARYQEGLQSARAENLPRRKWPVPPAKSYYARYFELATSDHPGAIRWCIENSASAPLEASLALQRRMDLYRKLIELFGDADWMTEVVVEVRRSQAAGLVELQAAASVCSDVFAKSTKPAVKVQALYNEALVWGNGANPEHKARAIVLFERLIAEYPESDAAARAQGKITQVKHLQVGLVAPDVVTSDVDGVPFKLSDYRGKVVVLDFWGFW